MKIIEKRFQALRIAILVVIPFFMMVSCEQEIVMPAEQLPSPVEGTNYYRLKQVDFDGTSETFDIMSTAVTPSSITNTRTVGTLAKGIVDVSDQSGVWEDGATWSNGDPLPYLIGNDADIVIEEDHNVTAYNGNLILGNVSKITIKKNAVLDVISVDIGKDSQIKVEEDAILIIRGDFDAKKVLKLDIQGTLIVLGSVNVDKDSELINDGDIYFADPDPNIDGGWDTAPYKPLDDLMNDNPDLHDVLPITVKWQKTTTLEDGSVLISFETAEEYNSDYVIVQWSIDAETWTGLKKIKSNNEPSTYEFVHR